MYGGGGAGGPRRRDLIPGVRGRHDADHDGDEVEKAGPVGAVRARGPAGKEGRSEVERDSARKTAGDGASGLRQPKPAKDAPPRVSFRRANSPARWLPRACASSS